jgi:hypothetical protein
MSEASVPLMVEEKGRVIDVQEGKRSFLFNRLTYYWVVFVSQALQIGLSTVATVAAINDENPKTESELEKEISRFAGSAIYSLTTMVIIGYMLAIHYRDKKRSDTRPKKFTMFNHVSLARSCAVASILNLLIFLRPLAIQYLRGDGSNDIRSIVIPVDISLFLVSAGASSIAAWITYTAEKRAGGIEQDPDPDYRAPAWAWAVTTGSRSRSAGNAIQLA